MREYHKQSEDRPTVSKADADYRKGSPAEHCGECRMFKSPHACTVVIGIVSYSGVCDYFKHK